MVLRLWVAVRMLCRSERIVGDDRLDISLDLMDHSSPMPGKTPIPPVVRWPFLSRSLPFLLHSTTIPPGSIGTTACIMLTSIDGCSNRTCSDARDLESSQDNDPRAIAKVGPSPQAAELVLYLPLHVHLTSQRIFDHKARYRICPETWSQGMLIVPPTSSRF